MKRIPSYKRKASFTISVLKWLDTIFINPDKDNNGHLPRAERLYTKFSRILNTRGKKEAIKFCKELRSSLVQWLTTIEDLSIDARKSSEFGLPKDLRFLKHVKDLKHPHLRLILSSLYGSRDVKLPVSPSIDSISGRPRMIGIPLRMESYISDFWYTFGIRNLRKNPSHVYWKKFHLSTKMGPNGQSLWFACMDLFCLPPDLFDSIKTVGGPKLGLRMDVLRKFSSVLSFFKYSGSRYRKVTAISDVEGKTREVAILDYWSQTALRGLHQYLFRQLRKIPQDCTFNQGGFKEKISKFSNNGHMYHSVDLTTATDRFPIILISLLLKGRFDECFVNSWQNIMVGHPFDFPQVGRKISYSVGNPMGAYSSWNSFALAHHFVVYYCCRELGIEWSEAPYVLLGDDIVIKHNCLARKYMEVMTSLGVEFSLQKSHISPHVFEFAKRTFHSGEEITPFPITALWSTRKSPSLMLSILTNEVPKGWISPIGTPQALSELYRILGFNATFVAKKLKDFYISFHIMEAVRGAKSAPEAVHLIVETYFPSVPIEIRLKYSNLPPFVMKSFLDNVYELYFMKMFRNSLLRSVSSFNENKSSKPLGLIAENLVIFITGREEYSDDMFDLIQAIPPLQIHGQVEETYMRLVNGRMDEIQKFLRNDWKTALRILTIPISDDVYVSRNQDLLIHSSFTFSKILTAILDDPVKNISPLRGVKFGSSP